MYNREHIFKDYPCLEACRRDMDAALKELIRTARQNKKVLVCGNGGSAADSEHIVGELMKGFLKKRPLSPEDRQKWEVFGEYGRHAAAVLQQGIKAISLPSQTGAATAFCNDCDPELVYAQLAWNYAEQGDILICISTSGNSKNIAAAAMAAKLRGAVTVALTGQKASLLSEIADITIRVPAEDTYRVQEYHLPVYHWLCAAAENELFTE